MSNDQLNNFYDLDERKKLILKTIVESYIKSPNPISSKIVGETCNIDVSSATIRAEMHALEEAGYLTHLHTSSGKVPTDMGYRFFVDNYVLNSSSSFGFKKRKSLKSFFELGDSESEISEDLSLTANKLSTLSSQTAIVIKDTNNKAKVSDVHTTSLADGKIVVALIMDDATIEKVVIDSRQLYELGIVGSVNGVELDQLKNWERILQGVFGEKGLSEINELKIPQNRQSEESLFIGLVCNSIESQISRNFTDTSVHLSGVAKLAENTNKEPIENSEITAKLLLLLEQQKQLAELIKSSLSTNTDAKIGSENNRSELNEHSIVISPFETSVGEKGALGVIGPKRMDYKKVFNLLDSASVHINKRVEE